jgi:hypothetical protein
MHVVRRLLPVIFVIVTFSCSEPPDKECRAGDTRAAARSDAERLVVELAVLTERASARRGGTTPPKSTGAAATELRALASTASVVLQEARSNISG